MVEITFETLPKAVANLTNEIVEIKRILLESKPHESENCIVWFNLNEVQEYLPDKPSKNTVYGWVRKGLIPVHKSGKKLRFLKSEIDEWLLNGKKETIIEIKRQNNLERDFQLSNIKRGKL